MKLKIDFSYPKKEILVSCRLKIPENEKDLYSFALADSFKIEKMIFQEADIDYSWDYIEMDLLPKMKKYTISTKNICGEEIEIKYRGQLQGSHRYFDPTTIHFSIYNGWYPLEFDTDKSYEVTINIDDSWELIKGTFNFEKKNWSISYEDKDLSDCNILLLNKKSYKLKENDYLKVYYQPYQESYALNLWQAYGKIMSYYEKLYSKKIGEKENLVILPYNEEWPNSDYKRPRLTVLTPDVEKIDNKNIDRFIKNFAHELGHNYGTGADTNTWEDWLNETVAEWSSLLFMKNIENKDPESFIFKDKKLIGDKDLLLNENGLERPEDVHNTGTLIFYEIYKNFGQEAIVDLLRAFDQIEEKTTKAYLSYLDKMGREDFADIIRNHIK